MGGCAREGWGACESAVIKGVAAACCFPYAPRFACTPPLTVVHDSSVLQQRASGDRVFVVDADSIWAGLDQASVDQVLVIMLVISL